MRIVLYTFPSLESVNEDPQSQVCELTLVGAKDDKHENREIKMDEIFFIWMRLNLLLKKINTPDIYI
jgi:hypothetical protein